MKPSTFWKTAVLVVSTAATATAFAQETDIPVFKSIVQPAAALEFSTAVARPAVAAPSQALPGVVVPHASAPPISREAVYAVYSTQYGGWEYMTSVGQLSTVGDHGGAILRVVVQEIGYGGTPTAYMAGSLLAGAKNYQNDPFCVVGGYYTTPCPSGYTIAGYYRYFNLDGNQSGRFTYQNTSLNSPFNTVSTAINIK